jgi:glycosyltransferase involved in cell wall biosynthesis
LGRLLSKRLNAELVFDVYDDYTEFGSNKLACMKRVFFRSLKKSSLVVFASSSLSEKYDAHCKSSILIENGVDTQIFRPMQLEDCRSAYDLPMGVEIVGYFGTIHAPRGTDVLVEAIRTLRKERDVLLILSGHIDGEVEIEADFVKYFGMLPQSQVAELVNACNVVALPYRDLEVMRMTNACKLMEYAACEKTVVCSDIHGYCHYASEGVVLAKPGDAVDLARALKEALVGRNSSTTISVLSWGLLAKRLDHRLRCFLG